MSMYKSTDNGKYDIFYYYILRFFMLFTQILHPFYRHLTFDFSNEISHNGSSISILNRGIFMNRTPIETSRAHYIDKKSPLPTYQQITNDLLRRIAQREWRINDHLPPETDLAEEYGVSRVTLRQAMALLERDQIIEKAQGKRAFIKNNPRQLVQELAFPTLDVLNHSSDRLPSKIIDFKTISAPSYSVRKGLNVSRDESLVYVQRLFYHNDKPTGVNEIWFKAADVPDFDAYQLLDDSISKTLRFSYGYDIVAIENYIESVRLDAYYASLLNTNYDALGLKIDSQHLLTDNVPLEYSSTIWLGDFTRFHYKVSK